MFSSQKWIIKKDFLCSFISDICQKEDHLLWVILDHWAMRMLAVGCQEQKMLMVGDPRKDGAGWCRAQGTHLCNSERHMTANLWIVYFWEFPLNIFRLYSTTGNHNSRKQTDKEDFCTHSLPPTRGVLLHRMDISYFLFPKTSSGFQRLNSFLQSVQGDISI